MDQIRLPGNFLAGAFLLLWIGLMEVPAQETILASGGEASGNIGTASYSIGQVFFSVYSLTEGYITEGVQQPYEIFIVSGLDNDIITLEYMVYPNPVSSHLILKVNHSPDLQLLYQLFDNKGSMLGNGTINGNECTISMEKYAAGAYYLVVVNRKKRIRTFKIIKN
jgi:hypothetical protein